MRTQNQNLANPDSQEPTTQPSQKFERNKLSEPYRSYFYRNQKQTEDPSPCQSSQTNKLSRTKNRLKSTRIKTNCIYYELESTKKNEIEVLKQENADLRKAIAELKIEQLYQIDHSKIRNLIEEVDNLKEQLKLQNKDNERLRLENDFLTRSNYQLKLEISKMKNKREDRDEASTLIAKQYKTGAGLRLDHELRMQSPKSSMDLPEHLIYSKNYNIGSRLQPNQMKISSTGFEKQLELPAKNKQSALIRMNSLKGLNTERYHHLRKSSKRKGLITEIQNNEELFE